jgi:DNA-binding transcriptional LysR family regulator
MNGMQSADANLIVALDALLDEGSVTAAARRMNVTAPAMSHTLARLRATLGDPLFVRSGNRLVPTPRAVALRDRVARAAGEVRSLLAPERPLDVATLKRAFVIRASDATVVTVCGPLNERVRAEAPGVALHFVATASDEVDLDIGVLHGRVPDLRAQGLCAPDLRVQRLYVDEWVPVVRKAHPMKRATPVQLADLEQIGVLTKARSRWPKNPPSRVVPSFLAAAALVAASDAYALLPSRLATRVVEPFGLRRLALTSPPTKYAIVQAWSARVDNDPPHVWLRTTVRAVCAPSDGVTASRAIHSTSASAR